MALAKRNLKLGSPRLDDLGIWARRLNYKETGTMNLESRMQLHKLIYEIVSLRIVCGSHEESATMRNKLESETATSVRKIRDVKNCTEVEAAQGLLEQYQEQAKQLAGLTPGFFKPSPKPERITLSI